MVNEARAIHRYKHKGDTAKNVFKMLAQAEDAGGLQVGKYFFSATAFIKASQIITESSIKKNIKYLVIDEIGPLELRKQQGFWQALQSLFTAKSIPTLILLARESLREELTSLLTENGFYLSGTDTVGFKDCIAKEA